MATYTDPRSVTQALTGAAVDTVNITGSAHTYKVANLSAPTIWVRAGGAGALVVDPTIAGAGCIAIQANSEEIVYSGGGGVKVKIIGNGETYAVFAAVQSDNAFGNNRSGFIELTELGADASAPQANKGRLYLRDNGSGKSQLVVRFPSGVVQILSTEP